MAENAENAMYPYNQGALNTAKRSVIREIQHLTQLPKDAGEEIRDLRKALRTF